MDNRYIGVFDSGLGGLTTVKALRELMPYENIIYLGDTSRVPYGSRSRETICKYAAQNAAFLFKQNIKALVVACNTVCSVALDAIETKTDIPVYEVVKTPAAAAALHTKNNKIGIIGTKATIKSGSYTAAIKEINPNVTVYPVSCPLFVPLVEEGWTKPDDEIAVKIVRRYLKELCTSDIDTLILGCTHYPLLSDVIKAVMGESVTLIDSGAQTAGFVATDLKNKSKTAEETKEKKEGITQYFVTDSVENFTKQATKYLNSDISSMVTKIELEQ